MGPDPKYVDVIVLRWQNYTGNKAVLDGEDRTSDDFKTERKPKLKDGHQYSVGCLTFSLRAT